MRPSREVIRVMLLCSAFLFVGLVFGVIIASDGRFSTERHMQDEYMTNKELLNAAVKFVVDNGIKNSDDARLKDIAMKLRGRGFPIVAIGDSCIIFERTGAPLDSYIYFVYASNLGDIEKHSRLRVRTIFTLGDQWYCIW